MKIEKALRNQKPNSGKGHYRKVIVLSAVGVLILVAFLGSSLSLLKRSNRDKLQHFAHKIGYKGLNQNDSIISHLGQLPLRLIQSYKSYSIPEISIDIKFKHFQKLQKKRDQALAKGILEKGNDDFVPASIRFKNKNIKVKVRLKGDYTDHLEGKKWSFRVHVKGKERFYGLRRFSIQTPTVRGFHGEILVNETFRHFGVLTPRYFFVKAKLNGDNIGLMAIEEHFSKELLEYGGKREGVIIRLDESLVWAADDTKGFWSIGPKRGFEGTFDNYRNAPIDAFSSNKTKNSDSLSKQFAIAAGLLRGFINGEMEASDVFDVKLLGRYLGVAEFWGGWHGIEWTNQRFYLNPISLKLEPIVFDFDIKTRKPLGTLVGLKADTIVETMLNDSKIFSAYSETVREMVLLVEKGTLIEKLKKIESQELPPLQTEFFLLNGFPFEELYARAKFLDQKFDNNIKSVKELENAPNPFSPEDYPTIIHAYTVKGSNNNYLEIQNAVPFPVEIDSIRIINDKNDSNMYRKPKWIDELPLELSPTPKGALPKAYYFYWDESENDKEFIFEILVKVKGDKHIFKKISKPYIAPMANHPLQSKTIEEQLNLNPFLLLDKKKRKIIVKQGDWVMRGSLIIPAKFSLNIENGTRLKFGEEGGIISYGPINFNGTKESPIYLENTVDRNKSQTWQGILLIDVDSPSKMTYTTIRNTSGIKRLGWITTGGCTFYQSQIVLENCVFSGSHSEDALNIVRSNFRVSDLNITNSLSDGFDIDFSEGIIQNSIFKNIGIAGGGDAVDLSGSKVIITATKFININDKALSVGENSRMKADNLVMDTIGTGVASKDSSHIDISKTAMENISLAGLMAYSKKPEFGSATIIATNLDFKGDFLNAIAQTGSSITIDGNQIKSQELDVDNLYKTVMKSGLRK